MRADPGLKRVREDVSEEWFQKGDLRTKSGGVERRKPFYRPWEASKVGMTMVPLRNGKKATWRYNTQAGLGSKALRGERGCV